MSGLRQRKAGGGRFDEDDDDKGGNKKGLSLASFDLYQKVQAEEAVQTGTGAGVSIVSYIVIALLVLSELYSYFVPKIQEHMLVDSVIEGRLRIDFDITFPALHCGEVNLDAMDVAGEQQNGIDHDITKTRLGADGFPIGSSFSTRLASENVTEAAPLPLDYCGSCFGAGTREGQCCNTCGEVRAAYAEKGWDGTEVLRDSEQCKRDALNPNGISRPGEGCRIAGFMTVNKVAGNFHIAMGETHARGAGHIHQFNPTQILRYNVTHTIHKLSFGEVLSLSSTSGESSYRSRGPLDGVHQAPPEGAGVYMYYVKVVPTLFSRTGQANVTTNQYSVTRQYRPAVWNGQRQNVLPGIFFVYDVTPFMIRLTAHTAPLSSVITNLCAILGGVIAAATLVDQVLYRLTKVAKGLGKEGGGGGGVPVGGAQGALADTLASAVTHVHKAAVTYGASPVAAYGYPQSSRGGGPPPPSGVVYGTSASSSGAGFMSAQGSQAYAPQGSPGGPVGQGRQVQAYPAHGYTSSAHNAGGEGPGQGTGADGLGYPPDTQASYGGQYAGQAYEQPQQQQQQQQGQHQVYDAGVGNSKLA